MPAINVVYYQEEDGTVPVLEWLLGLDRKAALKCRDKIARLRALGYELRRPEADYLRDGIYELRVKHRRINYRLLYFFYGNTAAVISHGITKEREIPPREIEKAVERKGNLERNPVRHMYLEV